MKIECANGSWVGRVGLLGLGVEPMTVLGSGQSSRASQSTASGGRLSEAEAG
jgi:hypothetical protein